MTYMMPAATIRAAIRHLVVHLCMQRTSSEGNASLQKWGRLPTINLRGRFCAKLADEEAYAMPWQRLKQGRSEVASHSRGCNCARTGIGQPDFGIVGADAARDGLADAPLSRPHLHAGQLLAQLPRAPRLHAQELDQLPAMMEHNHPVSRPIDC